MEYIVKQANNNFFFCRSAKKMGMKVPRFTHRATDAKVYKTKKAAQKAADDLNCKFSDQFVVEDRFDHARVAFTIPKARNILDRIKHDLCPYYATTVSVADMDEGIHFLNEEDAEKACIRELESLEEKIQEAKSKLSAE